MRNQDWEHQESQAHKEAEAFAQHLRLLGIDVQVKCLPDSCYVAIRGGSSDFQKPEKIEEGN